MSFIDQTLINIILSVICAFGGWFMKAMWDSLRDLKDTDKQLAEKVQSIEILVAGQYFKRDEFERFSTAIFAKLDKIESKVDGKADKH
jgi:hypothetical protein